MVAGLKEEIAAFLDQHHVMSLATLGPTGIHAASLFYARDQLNLIWMSEPNSRHSRDIEENADVAATVASTGMDYRTIRGVQIHGAARRIGDRRQRSRLFALLECRYPFLAQINAVPESLLRAYKKVEVYELIATDIVFVDNTKGFGHKQTLVL